MPPYRAAGSPAWGRHYGQDFTGGLLLPAMFATTGTTARVDGSFDGGLTWSTVDSSLTGNAGIAVSPDLGRVIKPTTAGTTLRYSDDGITWQNGTKPNLTGANPCNTIYGGPRGDRAFIIVSGFLNTIRTNKSATGLSWTTSDIVLANVASPVIMWDEYRQLYILACVYSPSNFRVYTSPDGSVWTQAFDTGPTGLTFNPNQICSGPNNRILLNQNSSTETFYMCDSLTADSWSTVDVAGWSEQRGTAGSEDLFFSTGVGGTNGGVSTDGGAGSWSNVTVPFVLGARTVVYVPEYERWVVLSASSTGSQGGIFTSEAPNLGSASWTRRETSSGLWAGRIGYGWVNHPDL